MAWSSPVFITKLENVQISWTEIMVSTHEGGGAGTSYSCYQVTSGTVLCEWHEAMSSLLGILKLYVILKNNANIF